LNDFCIDALKRALFISKPEIFNSDHDSQFTSEDFIKVLKGDNIRISMDGRGHMYDNIFVERLWRSVKYEEVYFYDYQSVSEAKERIALYFDFYNTERPPASLDYRTSFEVYNRISLSPKSLFGQRF